ncbi:blue light regulator 2 [Drepanopeziza brunnea f. sp. 'multigermtubi' MB_m1]|uniref:Blue light regulator 2 n=1 Tax=Marssonina brunnea f. sp. multigermtubi (strain MB_m1) TaxID=1072389 RepID=K1XZ45_MARBU|nr:blue light regulator 2 [Drepanopeziza brunnea f. sp. 'multigermtubi' MB_m1]EKD18089.1 blue light regulator 2 [Drepanopeziza brunnea f. sp. 'multigermtubi' MB_m1]
MKIGRHSGLHDLRMRIHVALLETENASGLAMNHHHINMDPSMYYSNMGALDSLSRSLSASQARLSGNDTSMTGMLEEALLDDYDNMPDRLDVIGLGASGQKGYTPLSTGMEQNNNETDETGTLVQSPLENSSTGVGAGPLPTGFGAQSTLPGGSTLTEFTKRRNWSQKVVEELKDFLHILTPDGRIVYISSSGTQLTGYHRDELMNNFIVDFIHPDDSGIFVREFNESIASGHPLRFFYRFRKKDDTYTIFESHGHPHLSSEVTSYPGQVNSSGFCKGFFMMARPYPTKNAALLDSFLEHKIENERLRKRIEDLKREEQEEAEASQQSWLKKQEGRSTENQSEETYADTGASVSTSVNKVNPDALAMPPPAKPSLNPALTHQNLENANLGSRPDSITDKMARYEGATHIETIEMLTGLRYRDGERSQGISTGHQSPALIRGDAGIAIPVDKDGRAADKKKKIKLPDEYVCTDCGTLDSPEWRKGPTGPKTLCNACGLRWAKKEKKRGPNSNGGGGSGAGSQITGTPTPLGPEM